MNLPECIQALCEGVLRDLHEMGCLKAKREPYFCAVVVVACLKADDRSAARLCSEVAAKFPTSSEKEIKAALVSINEVYEIREIAPSDLVERFCYLLGVDDKKFENKVKSVLDFFLQNKFQDGQSAALLACIAITFCSKLDAQHVQNVTNLQENLPRAMQKLKASTFYAFLLQEFPV